MHFNSERTVLVVAAHPDDEILGCGGTMKRFVDVGNKVYTLILSAGKASRGQGDLEKEQGALNIEMLKANELIGVEKVFSADFPDNAFDSVALLEIVKRIEEVKAEVEPDIIFTHHIGDMNIDHQIAHRAVLTATRPMVGETAKEVYSFEVPSSTEWNSFSKDTSFIPNVFVGISDTLEDKVAAMSLYKSELREYPHPRSLEYIRDIAKVWGAKVGVGSAEAFALIRRVIE